MSVGAVRQLGKYMVASELRTPVKTHVYSIQNRNGGELGLVKWYSPWRRYCFFPAPGCVFSGDCLEEIVKFLGEVRR